MKTRRCAWVNGLALCLALAVGGRANAGDVLRLVPEDALGFAVIHRLADTDGKLQKLSEQMQLPTPGPLATLKAMAQLDKGLDEKGSAAVIAMPGKKENSRPILVVALPVADYKEFVGQYEPEKVTDAISKVKIGKWESLAANKDGHVLFAQEEDQATLETVLKNTKHAVDALGPWKSWLADSDVVVVVTRQGLKIFSAQAVEALDKAKEGISAMGEQGVAGIAVLEGYKKVIELAGKEMTALGFGLVLEKDSAVRLMANGLWKTDGEMAQWFKNVKPLEGNVLAGLPKGEFMLAGGGPLPKPLLEMLSQFSVNMMKAVPGIYGFDEEQAKEFGKISAETMQGVTGITVAVGAPKPDQPFMSAITSTMWTEDSNAFLAHYAKQVNAMTELSKNAKDSPLKDMTVEEINIDGANGLKLTMDMSSAFSAPGMESLGEMSKKIYGDTKTMVSYIVAANDKVVVAAYLSEDNAKKAVAAAKDRKASLAGEPGVTKTTAALSADAQWSGFMSPQGTVAFAQFAMKTFAPEGKTIELPPFPATPPIGFSATVTTDGVRKELYIPAEVVKNAAIYAIQVRAMTQSE